MIGMESVSVKTKKCTKCGKVKTGDLFYNSSSNKDGLGTWCRACQDKASQAYKDRNLEECKARAAARYVQNKPRIKALGRAAHLRRKFNITVDQYEKILHKQGGGCACCGVRQDVRGELAVDHCHRTGMVRGILCTRCNRMIGLAKDDIQILLNAAEYLKPLQLFNPPPASATT